MKFDNFSTSVEIGGFMKFILLLNLFHTILSLVIMGFGYLLYKYPPKRINYVMGYRSKNSMSSQEKWDFANIYSGKVIVKTQLIPIAILWITAYFIRNLDKDMIGKISILMAGLQISVIFVSIFLTERALKKEFE